VCDNPGWKWCTGGASRLDEIDPWMLTADYRLRNAGKPEE
jgi:hypothetical protein